MSLDQRTQTDYRPRQPRPGRGRVVLLVLGVLVAVLAGAGFLYMATRDDPPAQLDLTVPSTAPSAPPAAASTAPVTPTLSPAEAEKQAILAQYQRFFQIPTPLSLAPAADRPAMFAQVAVDPSYSRTIGALAEADLRGEQFFGEVEINPVIVSVEGGTATIRDCQDTSQSGRVKTSDGTKVRVGRKDSLVDVTMLQGSDGVWRVSRADYADKAGCT
jgi:hypothetical protein